MGAFYVVVRGKIPNVYRSWTDCEKQVEGYHDCKFKKFCIEQYENEEEARVAAYLYMEQADEACTKAKQDVVYAVGKGKATGIFFKKEYCDEIINCPYTRYKSCSTMKEAKEYIIGYLKEESDALKKKYPIVEKKVRDFSKLAKVSFKYCLKFSVELDNFVQVYVDGSCFDNGKENATAGAGVYFGPDHPMNRSITIDTNCKQSNNVGELMAVKGALEVAKNFGIKKLAINADSHYVLQCFKYWIKGWLTNGWMLSTSSSGERKSVENKDLIQEILHLIETENVLVQWNYVRAHRGIRGNEEADKLAKDAAKRGKFTGNRFAPY